MIRIASLLAIFLLSAELFAEPPPDVHISEFSAANDRIWCSDDGDDPDWIEIHNAGNEVVDLHGWALTDQAGFDDRRWHFPKMEEVKLKPGSYLLVFASNQRKVTIDPLEFHTSFRLCQDGDSVLLLRPDGEIHDALTFPKQQRDVSYVRVDLDRIEITQQPTPGKPNGGGPVMSNCVSPWKSELIQRRTPCKP